jgi:general secretion pathway protein F
MPGFKYEAIDQAGVATSGVINADGPRQARQTLRDKGLFPVNVSEVSTEERTLGAGAPWLRVSAGALSLMMRQLSSLVGANINVERSLTALIEQTDSKRLKQALAGVRGEVLEGRDLSQAMRGYPSVFPEFYHAVVAVGENSGKLDKVLLKLADYTERSDDLRRKTTLAFVYPAILTTVAFTATMGLLIYVVPQIVKVFKRTHQQLPLLTRALIALSDFMLATWMWWLAGIVAAVLAGRWLLKDPDNRREFHKWLMDAPMAGWLVRSANMARLSSALAILVASGVPLLKALQAGTGVVSLIPMKEAVADIMADVREGGGLSRSMERRKGMFPPMLLHFVASGESSGKLGEMLERAAEQQAKDLEHRIAAFTSILEPALILTMGGVVLTIVLAVLMPIFELNQIVK